MASCRNRPTTKASTTQSENKIQTRRMLAFGRIGSWNVKALCAESNCYYCNRLAISGLLLLLLSLLLLLLLLLLSLLLLLLLLIRKNTISSIVIGLKKLPFPTNSLA